MGEVVRLFPRKKHLRGHIRDSLTDALKDTTGKPIAAVIVVLGTDGSYSLRAAHDLGAIQDFDMFARAEAAIVKEKMELL
jgi:hypothetical protein